MKTLPQTDQPVTLSDVLAELIELTGRRVQDKVRSPATLHMQVAHRRWLENRLGGSCLVSDIDEAALEEIANGPRRGPHRAGGKVAGPATLRKRLSTLKGALEFAHRRRRIQRVPAFPKVLAPWRPRQRYLENVHQARALFESLPLHRAEWFWLCLWTAQHASDVERMTWADVRLYASAPSILLRNTKNRRSPVWFALPKPLAEVLKAKWEREHPKVTDTIVLPWSSRRHTLPAHCRKLHLPELNAIDLRHTCLSWLAARFGITPALCSFAGHSSPAMMARTYAHALAPQMKELAEELDRLGVQSLPEVPTR